MHYDVTADCLPIGGATERVTLSRRLAEFPISGRDTVIYGQFLSSQWKEQYAEAGLCG